MAKQSVKGINPDLEAAISKMLKEVLNSPETSLIDKMRVIDRALNLEKIKQKVTDDAYGIGFLTDDADEE
jgi:AraC-like DNA-binding protein